MLVASLLKMNRKSKSKLKSQKTLYQRKSIKENKNVYSATMEQTYTHRLTQYPPLRRTIGYKVWRINFVEDLLLPTITTVMSCKRLV